MYSITCSIHMITICILFEYSLYILFFFFTFIGITHRGKMWRPDTTHLCIFRCPQNVETGDLCIFSSPQNVETGDHQPVYL